MFRRLASVLLLAGAPFSSPILAQTAAMATPHPVSLDSKQQLALGILSTAVVAAQAGSLLASATVTVPPGQEVTVTSPMSGTLVRLDAGLGDRVSNGASLALISSPQLADARRQLREAELDALNAQASLQREQTLYNEGIIPAARLQLSQNRQRAAEAAWQAQMAALRASGLAVDNSDYAGGRIVAPRAGSVVDAQASVGQRVEVGTVLFRIADLRQLQLDVVLSAEKAARLRPGDTVSVPSHGAKATLMGIGRSLDPAQQTRARARVTVVGRLQAGEVVQVQLQPSVAGQTTGTPRWQVPAQAVLHLQSKSWVVLAEPQRFVPMAVQLVSSNDDSAVVEAALQPKQRVVSSGLAALRPLLQKDE